MSSPASPGRVLFCYSDSHWGGIQHWIVRTADGLSRRGWTTRVAGPSGGEFTRRARDSGADVLSWDFTGRFRPHVIWNASRQLRTLVPDLVVVASARDLRTAGLAAFRRRVPVVWYMGRAATRFGWRSRLLGPRVVRVIVPSEDTRRRLAGHAWLDGKIEVVPNGIAGVSPASDEAREQARKRLGWKPGEFVILSVGRLHPSKGVDVFIDAFAQFADRHSSSRLVIVGGGAERAALVVRAESLSCASRITFAGYQSDPSDYFDGCDLFVLPSRLEPFGFVLLEAMARRKPIVAAATGGVPEVVGEDAAVLVPPEDPVALSKAIDNLIRDHTMRDRIAASGAERARRLFDESLMHDRTERIFREVLIEYRMRRNS